MYTPPENPADEANAVADYLAPAVAAAWVAFDEGRAAADDFFSDGEARPHDPHLWAHIARYQAALHLATEAKDAEWKLRSHHHSGIELVMDPFRVKVCKAVGDSPQNPGRNEARRRFYQQLDMFGGANLILHWRVKDEELQLGLCKPKGWWRFKSSAKLDWNLSVSFDPLAGLKFTATEEADVPFLFDADETGSGEATSE